MSTTTARPRQTTMAGAMVMLGGGFVVLSMWDVVSQLRSIEARETIGRVLQNFGLDSTLSVEEGIRTAHVLATVAAVCAVAAVALGWQALQRSRPARVALSALAVPLFLSGFLVENNGFAAALVAGATASLWFSPSREWFAGKPIPVASSGSSQRMRIWEQSPGQTGEAAPDTSSSEAPPSSAPSGWSVSASASDARPGPVTAALVITVVGASLIFIDTVVDLIRLSSNPDVILEQMRRDNPYLDDSASSEVLQMAAYVADGLVLVLSVLAITIAVLMATRRAWAARVLLVAAAVCGVVFILASLSSAAALIPALAAIATVRCLRHPASRAWFDKGPGPLS